MKITNVKKFINKDKFILAFKSLLFVLGVFGITITSTISTNKDEVDNNQHQLNNYKRNVDLKDNREIINNKYLRNINFSDDEKNNINSLVLSNIPSLTDYSFVKDLNNLKELNIYNCYGIDLDLYNYLIDNNINTNISDQDVYNTYLLNKIYDECINNDMSYQDKIKSITYYFINDTDNIDEYIYKNKITYMVNYLLNKSGIISYVIEDANNSWIIIEDNSKYYYIDINTLINSENKFNKTSIKYFNIGFNYMVSPKYTWFTNMQSYDSDNINIPEELINDIKNGEDKKNIIEKYSNNIPARVIEILIIIIGFVSLSTGYYIYNEDKYIKRKKQEALEFMNSRKK